MGRPKGSFEPGSLRSRIREILSDGHPRSARVLANLLGLPLEQVRGACEGACDDGTLRSRKGETTYCIVAIGAPVIPTEPRNWFQV